MCGLKSSLCWVRIALVLAAMGLLASCTSLRLRPGAVTPVSTCGETQADAFVSGAQRFPGRANAMSYIDKLLSSGGKDGDLIITADEVRFVTCGPRSPEREVFNVSHESVELAYRDRNWLILREGIDARGYRQYHAFSLNGSPLASGEELAKLALAEVRKRRLARGLFTAPSMVSRPAILIVSEGVPEVMIASVDHSKVGGETGKGMAAGAVAGVAVGLNPQAPIALYPPAAVVLLVGGALIGGASMGIEAERHAQRSAQMLPLKDPVLERALREVDIGPTLARKIEPLMQTENNWDIRVKGKGDPDCGDAYRDCALNGILGVIEIGPARIELRADKADLLKDEDQARQTLSMFQAVRLYSTLSGYWVDSVDVVARSDRHSLVEWREREGARLKASLLEAMGPMPDIAATRFQRALDRLLVFE